LVLSFIVFAYNMLSTAIARKERLEPVLPIEAVASPLAHSAE
jgi:hypothetical protein